MLWLGCVLSWWLVIWVGSLMVDSDGWFGCGWLLIVSRLCILGNGWFGFRLGLWWVTCLLWVAWPVVSNSIIPDWPFVWVPPITIWWVTYIFGWGNFGFGPSNLKYLVLILTHQMNIGQVKNKSVCLYPLYLPNE